MCKCNGVRGYISKNYYILKGMMKMWTQSIETLDPYEALDNEESSEESK